MIASLIRRCFRATKKRRNYQYRIIKAKMDANYYINKYADVGGLQKQVGKFDPVRHYINYGAIAGYDPHPRFSTSYYIYNNRDVAESDQNPFFHYIKHGEHEGRAPSKNWDGRSIWQSVDDRIVTASPPDDEERRRIELDTIRTEFDTEFYIRQYSDIGAVASSLTTFDPASHFASHGVRSCATPTAHSRRRTMFG
ncbi:hypothetical protein [Methylorubrum podarium]|uniref:hypothetical protein n=1 Tax=Methylorubrum podarium TaxID=200476 RepID=UPI001EE1C071|nr:hypothetical protein [Methylorubrum podarium]